MFYNSVERLKSTLLTVIKKPYDIVFRNTVKYVFTYNVNINDVKDGKCKALIGMIHKAIEAIEHNGLIKPRQIFDYCKTDLGEITVELESRLDIDLTKSFMENISKFYASVKTYGAITPMVQNIIDDFSKYKMGGLSEGADAINKLYDTTERIRGLVKDAVSMDHMDMLLFEETEVVGFDTLMQARLELDTFKVKTNTALDRHFDYFRPTKSYLVSALPGRGKSLTLLNICLAIKESNHFDQTVLMGLKPIVVYYTLENTILQTYERILSYYGYNYDDIHNMTPLQMKDICERLIQPKSPTDVRLCIVEKKRLSIDERYIIDFNKELKLKGYKVVANVVDYMALLKANQMYTDDDGSKMALTAKAEGLKSAAIETFTPIITAGQLNRAGEVALKEAMAKSLLSDPIRVWNGGHLAGSYQVKGEFDFTAFVDINITNGVKVLSVLSDKARDLTKQGENFKGNQDSTDDRILSCIPLRSGFKIGSEYVNSLLDLSPQDKTTVTIIANRFDNIDINDVMKEDEYITREDMNMEEHYHTEHIPDYIRQEYEDAPEYEIAYGDTPFTLDDVYDEVTVQLA